MVDGKFITSDHLQLTGSSHLTTPAHARANQNVNVIFGWMRDDGADFIGSFPTNGTTLTTALLGAGWVVLLYLSFSPSIYLCSFVLLCVSRFFFCFPFSTALYNLNAMLTNFIG